MDKISSMQPQDVDAKNLPSIRPIYQLHDTKAKAISSQVKLPFKPVVLVYEILRIPYLVITESYVH